MRIWMLFAVLGLGCALPATIPAPTRFHVPDNVPRDHFEKVIIAAVLHRPEIEAPRRTVIATEAEGVNSVQFSERLRQRRIDRETWDVFDVSPGAVTAGNRVGTHLLTVVIHYSDNEFWVEITAAEDLNYSGARIHPNALAWKATLETRIRGYFGEYSAFLSGNHPAAP